MRTLAIITISLFLMAANLGPAHAQSGVVSITVRPNPLKVSVFAPSGVSVGQWFEIKADITNLGSTTITKAMVTINSPGEVVVKGQKKRIGNLAGDQTETVTWRAKANSAGNFVIQVEAAGNLAGEQISSSDSTVVSVAESFAFFLFRLINGA